jgi:hypothetical protein
MSPYELLLKQVIHLLAVSAPISRDDLSDFIETSMETIKTPVDNPGMTIPEGPVKREN